MVETIPLKPKYIFYRRFLKFNILFLDKAEVEIQKVMKLYQLMFYQLRSS